MTPSTISRVHFIEFNARMNTLSATPFFPKYGTALLAAIMHEKGYETRMFLENVSDFSFERLTDCDCICLPVYAPALTKVRNFTLRVKRERTGIPVITGGPQAALYPDTVLDACDYAVLCEGDEVLPELVDVISKKGDPSAVRGISYMRNGIAVRTPDREPPAIPATIPDYRLIDGFRSKRRRVGRFAVMNTLQTSRGCAFRCSFCPTSKLFGGVYRNREIDAVIADIRSKLPYNRLFFVVDNSFLSNRSKTKALLERIREEKPGAAFIIFERHEIGRDQKLLDLMWKAGVRCIIVGIESLSDKNLGQYNKRQTASEVRQSVQNILDAGIHVIGTFVMGGDDDSPARADEIVEFVKRTRISLNLFIVHDVENDASKPLIIPLERRFQTYWEKSAPGDYSFWDWFTGNFVTYFPKRMKPSTLQRSLLDVYERVYTHRNNLRYMFSNNIFASIFGIGHGYSLRRLNRVIGAIARERYIPWLESVEAGLYDENENLLEDRLADLAGLPLPPPAPDRVDYGRYWGLIILAALPGIIRAAWAMLRWRITGRAPRPHGTEAPA
jgi:hypothetical protein